jgi:hypothetical protein
MYDRPNAAELIAAARAHLETQIIPAVKGDGKLYFQTLVAINVMKIVERELELSAHHVTAEWERLDMLETLVLQRTTIPLPPDPLERVKLLRARNERLCEDIQGGRYDASSEQLLKHLLATTIEQLQVANPKYLETLAAEDASSL